MEQRTDAWFAMRAGKATSSRVAALTAKTKNGWGASRRNTIAELVAERLSGACQDGFCNAAMQWGIDHEDDARRAYMERTGELVEEVAFIPHPEIEWAGASPDGLVNDDGMTEIKCPNTATHIDTLTGAPIPDGYRKQMLWQMDCAGRDWCDFVSFDPRMPPPMQLHIQRFHYDTEQAQQLRADVQTALDEVAAKVSELKSQYGEAA